MAEEANLKKLDVTLTEVDKRFGAGSVVRLGNDKIKPWPALPTGALTLDRALGIGGLPRGRIVEMYGPESSGKSTLALSVVAQAQAEGGICVYIDAEHALDPIYCKIIGVNMDDLLLSQPDYGEMALEVADLLTQTGAVDVIVIDSVAALVPKAELDGTMTDQQMGAQARMMSKALRKIVAAADENDTLIIFINQLREKIGVMFGNPETTPGGRALKFLASVRIDLRKIEDIKDSKGVYQGVKVKAKIVKNKLGTPLKLAEFDIMYGRGINTLGCILDLAVDKGVVTKSSSWYYLQGEQLAQGRENSIEVLASDLDKVDKIKELIENA